jgi:hypothetical protein
VPTDFATTYRPRQDGPLPTILINTTNPLAPIEASADHPSQAVPAPATTTQIWSGWFGPPDESVTGDTDPDHRTWSGPGRAMLDAMLAAALPRFAAADAVLWLRPHARHVLSDAPSCAAFLKTHAEACASGTLGLLLDLDMLITPDMAPRRAEHADRIISALAHLPGLAGIAMPEADWNAPPGDLATSLAHSAHQLTRA